MHISLLLGLWLLVQTLGITTTWQPLCQAEVIWLSSHTYMLIHDKPELDIQHPVGALGGICYESRCPAELPVVGRLAESDRWYLVYITPQLRQSTNWYQHDYMKNVAWIDIRDDGRLVGHCAAVRAVTWP
jgi:hypothetical protein